MVSCAVEWIPCEPALHNIIHNMRMVDALGLQNQSSNLMSIIIDSYHTFFKNQTSPYDVENEFRKIGLSVGLIAVEWKNDPYYNKIVENNGGQVVVRKNFKSALDICPTKYLTIVICKSRHDVIAETLKHHVSMDENMNKLKESGEMLLHLTKKYDNFHTAIQYGTLMIQANLCSYRDMFERVVQSNPDAQIIQINADLCVIVKDDIIICPIALQIGSNDLKYVLVGVKK